MDFTLIKKISPYLKVLMFWAVLLVILLEFLMRFYLHELPYKFLNHTTGPIRRLGQYSKQTTVPDEYLAIVGDSNVYGFGPWLYDNSWSMEQPAFATHHLLHQSLAIDVMAFGYPGYGTMGSCLSAVSELEMINRSWIWPALKEPSYILLVFYEGNDLINNLHEIEQRGFGFTRPLDDHSKVEIRQIIESEIKKLAKSWSWADHSASWNLLSNLILNYSKKLLPSKSVNMKNSTDFPKNISKKPHDNIRKENIALINGEKVELGFCEGPALLLTEDEIQLSLEVGRQSLAYIRQSFPNSEIDLVYLPSALSVYTFKNCLLRPAPLSMKGKRREGTFEPDEVTRRNLLLRAQVQTITESEKLGFIDSTPFLQKSAKQTLLHGPRDPIHFNREGYEAFAEAIIPQVKVLCEATGVKPGSNSTN